MDAPSSNRHNNRPRFPRPYNVSPEDLLNEPCEMHFYLNNDGRRQSGHLQKNCQTFQALRRYTISANAQAANKGYVQGPRSEIHAPLPPPPAITSVNRHQLQLVAPPGNKDDFINTRGALR
jgi:hypothetical protein